MVDLELSIESCTILDRGVQSLCCRSHHVHVLCVFCDVTVSQNVGDLPDTADCVPLHAQLAFLKFSFDIFWVQGVSESRDICHRCVFQAGEDSQFMQSARFDCSCRLQALMVCWR